jgi:RND family efflux transporter MFP subunit
LDLAQATFSRMQDLFNKKSVSNQEFDEASAKRKLGEANYAMAQARREQLNAKIQQAEQAVKSAQIMQGYSTVTSPATGIVTAKSVEAGALVTPGTPLLTIEQDGGWRLEAAVEESRLGTVKIGQAVEIEIDALPAANGRVSEIVPTVDPASRTFIAKIDIPASPNLRGGLFGRARFRFGERRALTVPASAVVSQGQLQKVYVVDSGTARARMVTTGAPSSDGVEILSGLSDGEQIINPVPSTLTDGARLEVQQ